MSRLVLKILVVYCMTNQFWIKCREYHELRIKKCSQISLSHEKCVRRLCIHFIFDITLLTYFYRLLIFRVPTELLQNDMLLDIQGIKYIVCLELVRVCSQVVGLPWDKQVHNHHIDHNVLDHVQFPQH